MSSAIEAPTTVGIVIIDGSRGTDNAPLQISEVRNWRLQARLTIDKMSVLEVESLAPQILIADFRGCDTESMLAFLAELKQVSPHSKLIAVGSPGDQAAATAVIGAGATAYLSRDHSTAALDDAVFATLRGRVSIGPTGQHAIASLIRGKQ